MKAHNTILRHKKIQLTILLVLFSCKPIYPKAQENNIGRLIVSNCYPCHSHNNSAPIEFITENDLIQYAKIIKKTIRDSYMPPWVADATYSNFCNEKKLSVDEKELLLKWLDLHSKPENGKKNLTSSYSGEYKREEVPLQISIPKRYILNGTGKDNIVQFIIPVNIPRDTFINEVEFIPDNPKIIHHCNFLVFGDSLQDKSYIKPITQLQPIIDEDIPYISPFPAKDLLYYGGWLPGAEAIKFPKGMGFKLPAKSYILLTIHYAPALKKELNQPKINLYFSNEQEVQPVKYMNIGSFGNFQTIYPPLIIPPDSIMKFEINYLLKEDMSVLYLIPHMHLIGKKIIAYAVTPKGDTIPLIKIDDWNFRWQFFYKECSLIKLSSGSRIIIQGTYNNTKDNINNPYIPPQFIKEGVLTNNEMLSLSLIYI